MILSRILSVEGYSSTVLHLLDFRIDHPFLTNKKDFRRRYQDFSSFLVVAFDIDFIAHFSNFQMSMSYLESHFQMARLIWQHFRLPEALCV